nr:hypothetical protein [Tanacetum cinerariifolium]
MIKNFDREDLESLWKIVRERFEKTEPKNYSDEYLLNTLKIMFEKPNVEANVWKDQKGKYDLAKVKSWKLFESCEVYCLTLSTTHIFLLVDRMYPLTHFTLAQMINDVRLKVEDKNEMSLELLRLVRRQLNKGGGLLGIIGLHKLVLLDQLRIKAPEQEVRQEKEVKVESSKREGESLKQEIAKKQKMEQKTKKLKKHLQIVPDDDDDVERFEKTEPKNYSDDYLLNTLKIMFEKPNVEANVWKDQKGKYDLAKVKSWKLFESCEVYCLTLSTTQIFLLVDRMYPLTHFTLAQMINDVRLKVEDKNEMSLELLRLVRRQLNKGGELLGIIGLHKLVLLDQLSAAA